jgi:hypothetical protein
LSLAKTRYLYLRSPLFSDKSYFLEKKKLWLTKSYLKLTSKCSPFCWQHISYVSSTCFCSKRSELQWAHVLLFIWNRLYAWLVLHRKRIKTEETYTPQTGVAAMLLHINEKFTTVKSIIASLIVKCWSLSVLIDDFCLVL